MIDQLSNCDERKTQEKVAKLTNNTMGQMANSDVRITQDKVPAFQLHVSVVHSKLN